MEEWHGGKVQYIKENVIHLMRGQDMSWTASGSLLSEAPEAMIFMEGFLIRTTRISEKNIRRCAGRGAWFRVNHVSWWKEEMPDEAEFEEGRRNLERAGWQVDFIVTHCTASSTQALAGGILYQPDTLTDYLEKSGRNASTGNGFSVIIMITGT